MSSGLILGPVTPITAEALHSLDAIALILLKTPRNEWEFVLLQAKSKAEDCHTLTPDELIKVIDDGVKKIKHFIKNPKKEG